MLKFNLWIAARFKIEKILRNELLLFVFEFGDSSTDFTPHIVNATHGTWYRYLVVFFPPKILDIFFRVVCKEFQVLDKVVSSLKVVGVDVLKKHFHTLSEMMKVKLTDFGGRNLVISAPL